MSEAHTGSVRQTEAGASFDLKKRLEQLARGECSADDFVRESLALRSRTTDSWDLLSFIDQRYRLGELPDDVFQSIKSRIAWNELQDNEFGTTVDLTPVPRPRSETPPPAASAEPVLAVDDIRTMLEGGEPVAMPTSVATVSSVPSPTASAAPALPREPAEQPAPPHPGQVLNNRYVLEEVIGSGGMGTVFKALDRCGTLPAQANRRVALKILRERSDQEAMLVQLRREFYCTQLLSHPNIVKVYELDRDADLAYYTMELLQGEPLHAVVARTRPAALPPTYAWAIIKAVGSALAHAHARGVIHGDLKPQNVLITADAEVRVLDFGSSRDSNESPPIAGDPGERLTATPSYASCDVLEGERPDTRDDLYSLACLCHELISGTHPFQGRSSLQARAAAQHAARPPGLSNQQWETLRRGLSWSRGERSISVGDWLRDFGVELEPQTLPPLHALPQLRTGALGRLPWQDFALPLLSAGAAVVLALVLLITPRSPSHHTAPAPRSITAAAPAAPQVVSTPASIPAPPPRPVVKEPLAPTERVRSAANRTAPVTATPAAKTPRGAEPAAARPAQITLASRSQTTAAGANFAEIRVHRVAGAADFVWWTEDGTAVAGRDYVAQARVKQSFSKGRRSATLYVRLIPNAERRGSRTFHVHIEPAAGVHAGAISRTTVELPASR